MSDETGEQRYWANSDEGISRTLRGKVERLRAEIAGLAAERSLHQDAAMTLLEQRDKLLDEIHGGERRTATLEAENARLRAALEDIAQTTGRVGLFPTDTLVEILDVARAALAAARGRR